MHEHNFTSLILKYTLLTPNFIIVLPLLSCLMNDKIDNDKNTISCSSGKMWYKFGLFDHKSII